MNTKQWLVRGGSLLVLIGFFLPSVMVSCSVTGFSAGGSDISQSFSLADLAADRSIGQSLLYLVPILMVGVIGLSFYRPATRQQVSYFIWGQVGLVAASLLFAVVASINLNGQVNNIYGLSGQYSSAMRDYFQVKPDFGALVILIGYIVAGVGLAGLFPGMNLESIQTPGPQPGWDPPSIPPQAPPYYPPSPTPQDIQPLDPGFGSVLTGPRLETFTDNRLQTFSLNKDNLLIGRSRDCDIILPHNTVSRVHARLRFAQGSWFIQDQDSSTGIIINGEHKNAARLFPEDQIGLGEVLLIFKA